MKLFKNIGLLMLIIVVMFTLASSIFAETAVTDGSETEVTEEAVADNTKSAKAIGASVAIALAAGLGAIAMGIVIAKSVEGIARQPEAEGKIRSSMMLGLVFVETAIIYALIVAILVIFVL